jgi:hypothetical protein
MDEQKNNNENGLIQLSHQELEQLQKSLTDQLNENLKKLVELHPDIDYNHQLSLLKKLYDLLKNCLCK